MLNDVDQPLPCEHRDSIVPSALSSAAAFVGASASHASREALLVSSELVPLLHHLAQRSSVLLLSSELVPLLRDLGYKKSSMCVTSAWVHVPVYRCAPRVHGLELEP